MIYTVRNQLTVITLQEERNVLTFEELFQALINRPSLIVYVELRGRLLGIITLGRIARAYQNHQKQVEINTKYTFVFPDRHMEAREMFYQERTFAERKKKIHVLPVVDCDGRLLGEYAQDDNLLSMGCFLSLLEKIDTSEFIKHGFRIALVAPKINTQKKQDLFLRLKESLLQKKFAIEIIGFSQVLDCSNTVDYILFFEEQACGLAEVLRSCFSDDKEYRASFVLLKQFLYVLLDRTNRVLTLLQRQGVYVLAFDFEETPSGYLKKFTDDIEFNRRKNGWNHSSRLLPEMKKSFLLDLYKQLADVEFPIQFSYHIKDGVIQLRDVNTPYLHVKNGNRLTVNQPPKYTRCVYLVGPCIILGNYTDDQHTIPSLLQKMINSKGLNCKVENCGTVRTQQGMGTDALLGKLLKIPIKQGDIVIFDKRDLKFAGIPSLNLTNTLEQCEIPVDWFINMTRHCNHKAYQVFAESIYENISSVLQQPVESRRLVEKGDDPIKQFYLDRYFTSIDLSIYKTVGSIVMNCNPFTFGHRYLIEEARKQVEFLIIFVVEEDLSLFSFEERFAMVCAGTSDLNNVMVIPSGAFVLSKMSFPEYFVKETDDEIEENTENDIMLFAERIAPTLRVTHRFVGEEPEDHVTNMYNQAMKRILPNYGIQLVEIKRKYNFCGGGAEEIISASRVRKYLEKNDLAQLDSFIPDSTKEILFCCND